MFTDCAFADGTGSDMVLRFFPPIAVLLDYCFVSSDNLAAIRCWGAEKPIARRVNL